MSLLLRQISKEEKCIKMTYYACLWLHGLQVLQPQASASPGPSLHEKKFGS